uniref:Uncharacterized protein n=1 Tax=Corethron hystrix TaxID=216773 RepID=A0A7S1BQ59_9STRA|mmetsp:Transcript_34338/g.79420  ORF Transcript_34338/g.79420 Transcript_34338/m.79420 type:complete len:146 (+) Transcript_34338:348-785(+)|eukprot:CAMPEP_0113297094 /NCGR_PEP_ID=MMETSP0010_2-20120614/99_1 /TAXON_ID=216773 ORGANISM="Corethron hystrix, Strain 308" /NCGR_SAMPLE_ID=MMETSP0010_2 /ASSEMBLY_ACC=CAM_ASM_000155 /LENGTH=145 /DNA_ID=CAMNT_0000149925 /DNA_START=339 /DNA_END=776 /DNA_ORIENTATION=+ /assembly_acc=CAM_ASM_000155
MIRKLAILLAASAISACTAFVPTLPSRNAVAFSPKTVSFDAISRPSKASPTLKMVEDTFWEGEYPPSKVLGPILSKMPSGLLGLLSLGCLGALIVSIGGSAALQQEPGAFATGSWVKWYYILGSFGGPLAWGLHVASWIQRKNGM